ncbi:MAG: hypothetical protein ACLGGV_04140 [Bacteroidia bacterium]
MLARKIYRKLNHHLMILVDWDKRTPDLEKGTLIHPNLGRLAHLLGEKVCI